MPYTAQTTSRKRLAQTSSQPSDPDWVWLPPAAPKSMPIPNRQMSLFMETIHILLHPPNLVSVSYKWHSMSLRFPQRYSMRGPHPYRDLASMVHLEHYHSNYSPVTALFDDLIVRVASVPNHSLACILFANLASSLWRGIGFTYYVSLLAFLDLARLVSLHVTCGSVLQLGWTRVHLIPCSSNKRVYMSMSVALPSLHEAPCLFHCLPRASCQPPSLQN